MSDKSKRGEVKRLDEALAGYVERSGIKRRLDQARVIEEWSSLVGPQIAEVTRPSGMTPDGTLFVAVRTAAWAQELQLMSSTILAELRKKGRNVRRIVWRAE